MFQLPENIRGRRFCLTFASYGQKAAMSTAFGPSGIVLMDLAAKINPGARVFFIDTGYHFEETLQMIDRVQERFDIDLQVIKPKRSVADQRLNLENCIRLNRPLLRIAKGGAEPAHA